MVLGPELVDVRLAGDLHVGLGLGAGGLVALPLVDAQAARLLCRSPGAPRPSRRRLLPGARSAAAGGDEHRAARRSGARQKASSVHPPRHGSSLGRGCAHVRTYRGWPGVSNSSTMAIALRTIWARPAAAAAARRRRAPPRTCRSSARCRGWRRGSSPRRRRPFARCAGAQPGREPRAMGVPGRPRARVQGRLEDVHRRHLADARLPRLRPVPGLRGVRRRRTLRATTARARSSTR